MQTCYNCGQQVGDDVLICPNCGALVRRYTDPPRRDPEPEQPEETQQPYFDQPEAAPACRPRVWRDANGKLRLAASVKAFMIVMTVLAGYLALSFACLLFVYHNQDVYAEVFQMMSGADAAFSAIADSFELLMTAIGQAYGFILALIAISLARVAASIWFLCAKRRAVLFALLILCGVLAVGLAVAGYALYAIVAAADGVVTSMLLRRDLRTLK